MTEDDRSTTRRPTARQQNWSVDAEGSAEQRQWMLEAAAAALATGAVDPVAFPNPLDLTDAEVLELCPRYVAKPESDDPDAHAEARWLNNLDDFRWVQLGRAYLAIRGGWPLPPPITWLPVKPSFPETGSEEEQEFLQAVEAHARGEGPRAAPANYALQRVREWWERVWAHEVESEKYLRAEGTRDVLKWNRYLEDRRRQSLARRIIHGLND